MRTIKVIEELDAAPPDGEAPESAPGSGGVSYFAGNSRSMRKDRITLANRSGLRRGSEWPVSAKT